MGTVLCAVVWKQVYFLFQKQKSDKPSAVVEKVLFLFLFVEFEISCDSAGWMSEENTSIQRTGCSFRRAAAGNFCDLKRNLVKLKTLSTGVRIFNGAVLIVLIITRNGAEISRSRSPNTISVSSVSKCFRISPAPCRR